MRVSGKKFSLFVLSLPAVTALAVSPAFADVGIPMIACVDTGFWLLLPIVILVEGIVALIVLRKGIWTAAKVSVTANLLSTLAGIPLSWLIKSTLKPVANQFVVSLYNARMQGHEIWWSATPLQKLSVTLFSQPMCPAPISVRMWWIWISWAILLVPLFLLSVWIERLVAQKLLGKTEQRLATRWAWIANAVSYAAIYAGFLNIWGFTWWFLDLPYRR